MSSENAREHKANWIALNWFKLSILFLSIGATFIGFYWYSIRPSQIKQECSWVTKTKPAIVYRAAMTTDEMQKKGMLKTCKKSPLSSGEPQFSREFLERRSEVLYNGCLADNKKAIAKYTKEQPAIPAKEYKDRATEEEYVFCLHKNGL
jgi:hypothetical protein